MFAVAKNNTSDLKSKRNIYFCIFFLATLFLFVFSVFAETIYCDQCGRSIGPGRKYIKANGKTYCSKKCYKKTLPTCPVCGKIVKKGLRSGKDGKIYCSKKCLASTWPVCDVCGKHVPKYSRNPVSGQKVCIECMKTPKCFCCSNYGAAHKLKDGRNICSECLKTAVMEYSDAEKLFNEVRRTMKRRMRLSTNHDIDFQFIDIKKLKKNSPGYGKGLELGLFNYWKETEETVKTKHIGKKIVKEKSSRITSEKYTIYMLYGMTRAKYIEVAAHELAHDWMQEYYPEIKNLKVKEGWAEFVASVINKAYGNEELNKRMELNSDSIYGDGYKMIKNIYLTKGRKGVFAFFKEKNGK